MILKLDTCCCFRSQEYVALSYNFSSVSQTTKIFSTLLTYLCFSLHGKFDMILGKLENDGSRKVSLDSLFLNVNIYFKQFSNSLASQLPSLCFSIEAEGNCLTCCSAYFVVELEILGIFYIQCTSSSCSSKGNQIGLNRRN